MWASIVVLAVSAVVLVAAVLVARPARSERASGRGKGRPTRDSVGSAELLLRSESDGHGGLNVLSSNGDEVLFSMVPASVTAPALGKSSSLSPAATAFGGFVVAAVPGAKAMLAAANTPGFRVVFKPSTMRAFGRGTMKLMRSNGKQLPVAVDRLTGRITDIGRITSSATALAQPQVIAMLAIAAAISAQLYVTAEAYRRVQAKLDALLQRAWDDDHGELAAAEELMRRLLPLISAGDVPPQYAAELAVARQRVEAIYFSRLRFVDRFRQRLEASQNDEEASSGETRAWGKGATKAFGSAEAFEAEILLYSASMITRARLSLCSAALLSLDGYTEEGFSEMAEVAESIRDEFHDLERRLRALGGEEPRFAKVPLMKSGQLQQVAERLARVLEADVAPLLPERPGREITFITAAPELTP